MRKKTFKICSFLWAIVWAVFAAIAWYIKLDVGTIATLGGIALMFAWMYEQQNLRN